MAHISKDEMPSWVRNQIEKELTTLFFATNTSTAKSLFLEVLTETELLMLAKRVVTILMLIDEQSYYRIEQVLGVSVSTSKRLHRLLIGGEYSELEKMATNNKARQELARKVGTLLRGGLPARAYIIKKRKMK